MADTSPPPIVDIHMRIPRELHTRIKQAAQQGRRPINTTALILFEEALDAREQREEARHLVAS